jgi:RNA polymerase sigma-70 factor (ECF subfamily)
MTSEHGLTDHELEAQVLALNRAYSGIVHAISRAYALDEDEADDIAQQIWKRVSELLRRKPINRPEEAWIRAVGIRVAMNERARRRRWQALMVRLRLAPPPDPSSPRHERVDFSVAAELDRAVEALPPRQREVVRLRDYRGLSVAEAAEEMACAPGTVKATHHHAIRNLAKALAHLKRAWFRGDISRPGDPR